MHGAFTFGARSFRRVILHRDALRRVNYFDWKALGGRMLVQLALHGNPVADEQNPVPKLFGRMDCAFDLGYRSLIAPHRVYGNGYHSFRLMRSRGELFRRCFDYFAALVLSALGADAVRLLGLMAIRAFGTGRLAQCIVSAAGLSALVGVSAFRIRHCFSLFLFLSICY